MKERTFAFGLSKFAMKTCILNESLFMETQNRVNAKISIMNLERKLIQNNFSEKPSAS